MVRGMRIRALLMAAILTAIAMAVARVGHPLPASHEARAEPPPPTSPPPTGWTAGTVAAGTADVLAPVAPTDLSIPLEIASRVTGPTALFYFSPTCPHCKAVMPEIEGLDDIPGLRWIGVSHGGARAADLAIFVEEFSPPFEIVVDQDRTFAAAVGARSTPSLYLVEPVPEDATGPDGQPPAPGTVRFVEAYAPYVRGLGPIVRMRRHPQDPYADFEGYQGGVACEACHTEEGDSMSLTGHSVAYRTLYLRDRAQDLQCVGCHVTGMDKTGRTAPSGGFVIGDHGSPLNRVGCEACHGPSGPHDGERTDARTACTGCHDAEHSVAFTVEKGLPHIDHFVASTMSEAEIEAKLVALGNGDGGRPLLAFPAGPTSGAAACKRCHKAEHKWWRSDRHAQSLDTLREADIAGAAVEPATTPACVNCHATQQAYGGLGVPDSLDGFRMDEGVGCEACHGPCGEHCDAPTADNIVGLGKSCPECVVEGVCTACHVPAWDPSWELQKRLGTTRH